MCLYVLPGAKIETAKEDIKVYKILLQGNLSPYKSFQYKASTLYRLRKALEVNPLTDGMIYAGYHAYTNKVMALRRCDYLYNPHYTKKVVTCIIPKGAKYCLGSSDEIVSTSLRTGKLKALRKS